MASLKYDDIFSYFLGSIEDNKLASLDEKDVYVLLKEYLHKAVSDTNISKLFSKVKLDDEIEEIVYTMAFEKNTNEDEEFLLNILSKGMVCEWLKPIVRSKVNTSQMFGGKEQKFYSQSNHIAELMKMKEDIRLEVKRISNDRGCINNSYLEGEK